MSRLPCDMRVILYRGHSFRSVARHKIFASIGADNHTKPPDGYEADRSKALQSPFKRIAHVHNYMEKPFHRRFGHLGFRDGLQCRDEDRLD